MQKLLAGEAVYFAHTSPQGTCVLGILPSSISGQNARMECYSISVFPRKCACERAGVGWGGVGLQRRPNKRIKISNGQLRSVATARELFLSAELIHTLVGVHIFS